MSGNPPSGTRPYKTQTLPPWFLFTSATTIDPFHGNDDNQSERDQLPSPSPIGIPPR
jgi:hypothetical protein